MMILCANMTFICLYQNARLLFINVHMDMNAVLNTVIAFLYSGVSHLRNVLFVNICQYRCLHIRMCALLILQFAVSYQYVILCHVMILDDRVT